MLFRSGEIFVVRHAYFQIFSEQAIVLDNNNSGTHALNCFEYPIIIAVNINRQNSDITGNARAGDYAVDVFLGNELRNCC